jgi:hypothetical protein
VENSTASGARGWLPKIEMPMAADSESRVVEASRERSAAVSAEVCASARLLSMDVKESAAAFVARAAAASVPPATAAVRSIRAAASMPLMAPATSSRMPAMP